MRDNILECQADCKTEGQILGKLRAVITAFQTPDNVKKNTWKLVQGHLHTFFPDLVPPLPKPSGSRFDGWMNVFRSNAKKSSAAASTSADEGILLAR